MEAISGATWLAVGYGLFLLAVAHGLDALARRTSSSALSRDATGFTYHADHDAWLCPEDQWLWPESFDAGNRVVRYRASPTVCNSCPVKDSCTTSGNGRQLSRNIDPWPGSEAERFHRGIACSVSILALVWPVATAFTAKTPFELAVLGTTVVVIALGALPLFSHLRRSPAAFPDAVKAQDLDDNVAEQRAGTERAARRRSHYTSDRYEKNPPGQAQPAVPAARDREAPVPTSRALGPDAPVGAAAEHDRFATLWRSAGRDAENRNDTGRGVGHSGLERGKP